MYKPIGDRVLITRHKLTKEYKEVNGIWLPEGLGPDGEDPSLGKVIDMGKGPACEFLQVGDMVLIGGVVDSVYQETIKQDGDTPDVVLEYYIVNAAQIVGRVYRSNERGIVKEGTLPN